MGKSFETKLRKFLRRTKIARSSPRVQVSNRRALEQTSQAIPTVVYQLCERAEVSAQHHQRLQIFREANPSFDFVVIDAQQRDQLMAEDWGGSEIYSIFERARFGQLKNDIFKYCFLYKRGGYIFELPFGVTTSLAQFHQPDTEVLISTVVDISSIVPDSDGVDDIAFPLNMIAAWGFGFIPGHALLEACIGRIVQNERFFSRAHSESPRRAVRIFSGSGMLTREFRLFAGYGGLEKVAVSAPNFVGRGFVDRDHSLLPTPDFPARFGESILHQAGAK